MSETLQSHPLPTRPGSRRPVRRPRAAVIGLVAVTLAFGAGCSDDTEDVATGSPDTTAAAGADNTKFCDGVVAADAAMGATQSEGGPPDPDAVVAAKAALADAAAAAPEEIAAAVQEAADGGAAMLESESGEPPAGFAEASATMYEWVGDNCGFGSVEVTAIDYEYEGMPTDLDSGASVVELTNEGTELHEMIFVRVNDDVTESTDELLALPEEEALAKVTMKGAVFAMPGETSFSTVDLEPGRYIVSCFIPVGLTPAAMAEMETSGAPPEGPPHFTQGMVHDITVA